MLLSFSAKDISSMRLDIARKDDAIALYSIELRVMSKGCGLRPATPGR